MKTRNGIIVIEDYRSADPSFDGVTFTDETNISIFIPMKTLLGLYEIAKYDIERMGINWEQFSKAFFKKDTE